MALGPEEIGNIAGQFFDNQVWGSMLTWLGYIAVSALILGVFVMLYFTIQYKYKVKYPKLHYSPDGESAQIIGWYKDRARTIKRKDGTVQQHILWANAKVHKFDDEHILPGNKVMLLKIDKDDGSYIPMPTINFSSPIASFATIKPEAKYWAILQLKENERTYADVDAQKRILTYTIIAVIAIMLAIIVIAWIIMKQFGGAIASFEGLKPSLQGMAEAFKGSAPG